MLNGLVAGVEERRPPGIEQTDRVISRIASAINEAYNLRLLSLTGTAEQDAGPVVQKQLLEARRVPPKLAADLDTFLVEMDLFRSQMLTFLQDVDVIVCPVNAYPALAHGLQGDDEHIAGWSYCGTYSVTGWPAAVVRAGTSTDGMPIGVQIVGRPWREDVVLAVAAVVESSLGGWQPP
jgi:amidase